MSSLIENLKSYFANTSREKILMDWEETLEFDNVGITMDEFLIQTNWNFRIKTDDPLNGGANLIVNNYSPKFSSDFFLYIKK